MTRVTEKGDTMKEQNEGNMTISVLVVLSIDFPVMKGNKITHFGEHQVSALSLDNWFPGR